MNAVKCPSKSDLSDYALGLNEESDSSEIEVHLETCRECQAFMQTAWQSDDSFMKSLRAQPVQDTTSGQNARVGDEEPATQASGADSDTDVHPQTVRD